MMSINNNIYIYSCAINSIDVIDIVEQCYNIVDGNVDASIAIVIIVIVVE
jgi:hypothetical protein